MPTVEPQLAAVVVLWTAPLTQGIEHGICSIAADGEAVFRRLGAALTDMTAVLTASW